MRVLALVEYWVVGDDRYRYIETFEFEWANWRYDAWRRYVVKHLFARGILCNKIKCIEVTYEK
jgi:hypothetical protein